MKQPHHIASCPSCQSALRIRRLECEDCGLALEGQFSQDSLFQMSSEDLHFIRLFLHSEGSIRDMEKSLGVSYPTVKARLQAIKSRLQPTAPEPPAPPTPPPPKQKRQPRSVLDQLESGEMDFASALAALKKEGK